MYNTFAKHCLFPAILSCSLRDVLDSLLLGALSVDKRDLVLSFTNLAVGGAYLPPTSNGRLLTVIHQDAQRGVETIQVGGANSDGDILVDIEGGAVNSSVQITVYNGDELFMESNCSNASNSSVGGVIVGPIISVINEGAAPNDNEVVTIQYNQLNEERAELVCVRWTTDQLCKQHILNVRKSDFFVDQFQNLPTMFLCYSSRIR